MALGCVGIPSPPPMVSWVEQIWMIADMIAEYPSLKKERLGRGLQVLYVYTILRFRLQEARPFPSFSPSGLLIPY